MNLRKSTNSVEASISACHAFFPWPRIVAAIISGRYFPAISSAAFRNTAARSANGADSHAGLAARADEMAAATCSLEACEEEASVVVCDEGIN